MTYTTINRRQRDVGGGTSADPNPAGETRLRDWLKPSGSTRRGGKKK